MYQWYEYEKDGTLLLFMEISSSFAPDCYFKVYKENSKIIVYSRTELSRNDYYNIFSRLDIDKANPVPLGEITKTLEYRQELEKICPIHSQELTSEQEKILLNLLNAKLDEKIELSGGRDGHSYRIQLYGENPSRIDCWCIVTSEWSFLANAINMLVIDVAGLDAQHYAIQTRNS